MSIQRGHQHGGFEIPAGYADPLGRPVDHQLLGQFTGRARLGYDRARVLLDHYTGWDLHQSPISRLLPT